MAVAILIGVLDGLHAAHEARSETGQPLQIVHRDVSPQNVLIGVDGAPKILDFGIAKAVGRMQMTRGDQLKGKLAYMAPEHLAREPLDRRGDVYAAGILFWELLTGEQLFQARYQTARELSLELHSTGLSASTRELSAWLCDTAEQSLSERAARIAEDEAAFGASPNRALSNEAEGSTESAMPAALSERLQAGHAATSVLALTPKPESSGQRRGRALPWAMLIVAVLFVTSAGAFWLRREGNDGRKLDRGVTQNDAAKAREPQVNGRSPAEGTTTAAQTITEPAAQSAKALLAASASASGRSASASRPARSTAGKGSKKGQRAGCETPFTVDAHGVKVPKLECL
jgi:serine/threonine-protein kinase